VPAEIADHVDLRPSRAGERQRRQQRYRESDGFHDGFR
jgi:hypothetical protein